MKFIYIDETEEIVFDTMMCFRLLPTAMASTSTGQMTRVKVETELPKTVSGWSRVFPAKVETEQQSCLFMKKLVTASISNITYLRNMFPEDAYARKTLDKVSLRILKAKSSCEKAAQLSRWLLGRRGK